MANELNIYNNSDEAEDADYFVCVRADVVTPFKDNLFDFCCKCGEKVQFRPHGPTVPKKICFPCVMPKLAEQAKKGELEIACTKKTAEEVAKHLKRN